MPLVVLGVSWLIFALGATVLYVRAERKRQVLRVPERDPELRSKASLYGLALEMLGYAIVWTFRRPESSQEPALLVTLGTLLAPASVVLFLWALVHLGREFRIQAVVVRGHVLATSGPYAFVRHPVYLSMLGLLVSNAMVVSRWDTAIAALVVYLSGTEIRVRAEDDLLARRFGVTFENYRVRVPAYLPYLR